jgi:hypothetical protein
MMEASAIGGRSEGMQEKFKIILIASVGYCSHNSLWNEKSEVE